MSGDLVPSSGYSVPEFGGWFSRSRLLPSRLLDPEASVSFRMAARFFLLPVTVRFQPDHCVGFPFLIVKVL